MNAPATFRTRERIAMRDAAATMDRTLRRDLALEVRADGVNEETRTVDLSFSSEEPYERWWGTEILDHGPSSVRLGRLNGGAAVLVNHDTRDQVGVVENASINGRRGRATVRFGRSARAEEVFQDVRDGIRKLVSVGYRIISIVLERSSDSEDVYRVTEWEPYEISLVAVPADATVGVDRDGEEAAFDPRTLVQENDDMNRFQRRDGAPAPAPILTPTVPAAPAVDLTAERNAAVTAERQRVASITALGSRLGDGAAELVRTALADGRSVEQFIADFSAAEPNGRAIRTAEAPEIGMTDRETQRYSFLRALHALANPNDRAAQAAAAFEVECSAAAAQRTGRESRGLMVPVDVLRATIANAQRDLTVGTATAGGHTVATDLLAGSFIDLLRNSLALSGLGVRMLTDLNGNVAIPRQTGGATAYWVGENAAPTESQQAFDQVALTPKTVGAFTDMSRRLLIQSSIDVEALVRQDLATILALAIDLAGVNGSGSSNQPRGILQTSGIGSVPGGTNGLAPAWSHIVGLETAVAVANADVGNLAYLTNTKVRGTLKQTQRFTSTDTPIWGDNGMVNGYKTGVSNQVPSNLTKGSGTNLSAIIFGNWADLLIGMWGGLDLLVDPFTGGTAGTVRVSVLQDVDVSVRHAESFAAMVDAITL
jgi:HK97 family phage major capsid protein/HK97 family phage prohead protease